MVLGYILMSKTNLFLFCRCEVVFYNTNIYRAISFSHQIFIAGCRIYGVNHQNVLSLLISGMKHKDSKEALEYFVALYLLYFD